MKALSALLLLLVCAACQQAPKSEPLFFGHTREYWRDLNEKFKAEDAAKQQKEWEDSAPQRQAQAERDAKEEREWRKQQAKQKAQEQAEAAKHFQSAEEYAQQLSAWRESQRQQQLKAVALRRWTGLNADRLKYEFVFAGSNLRPGATDHAQQFSRP